MNKKFDTTPKPYFLQAMRNQSWTMTGALAELVDNSFGPGRGNANTCEIVYDPTKRLLIIQDDGVGMPSIGRLFQLGNTIGRAPGDIGLYGSGGTMAILWLADSVADVHAAINRSPTTRSSGKTRSKPSSSPASTSAGNQPASATHHRTCSSRVKERPSSSSSPRNADDSTPGTSNATSPRSTAPAFEPAKKRGRHSARTPNATSSPIRSFCPASDHSTSLAYGDDLLPVVGQVGLVDGLAVQGGGGPGGLGPRRVPQTQEWLRPSGGNGTVAGASVTGCSTSATAGLP